MEESKLSNGRLRVILSRQTIFSAFEAENASSESNFKGTFMKNIFVFSLFTSNNPASPGKAQLNRPTYYVM